MKIGFTELILVMVVALLVIGPDKLPQFMRQLGKGLAQFKAATDEATKEIRQSVVEPLEEAQKPLREALEPVQEIEKAVNANVKDLKQSINSIGKAKPDKKEETDAEERVADVSETNAASIEEADQGSDADVLIEAEPESAAGAVTDAESTNAASVLNEEETV